MLTGNKVLIAGAGGLLGCQLCKDIIEAGASVIAVDVDMDRMKDRLKSLDIDLDDGRIECVQVDMNDENMVKDLFERVEGLTGVVNTLYPRNKTYGRHFFDVDLASFNENVSLNLGASFLLLQNSARYSLDRKCAMSVVNISSIYGVVAPDFSVYDETPMTMPVEYAAIKSAQIHLSRYVASYVGDSRFRVNCVSPGGLLDGQPERFLAAYQTKTFGKGMLSVGDISGAVKFLLSSESKYVNGQNITVDDGFTI